MPEEMSQEEIHEIRMRNMRAVQDVIERKGVDLDLDGLETEEKPKTDYERYLDERNAAQHLRDVVQYCVGLTVNPQTIREEFINKRLQEALDHHATARDQSAF